MAARLPRFHTCWPGLTAALIMWLAVGCASTPTFKLPAGQQASVEKALQVLALELGRNPPSPEQVVARLQAFVQGHPDVFGSTLAYAAPASGPDRLTAPYVWRQGGMLASKELYASDYLYRELPWYNTPATTDKATWSKPYFDQGGGNIWMATYSIPLYTQGNETRLIGILTADLALHP